MEETGAQRVLSFPCTKKGSGCPTGSDKVARFNCLKRSGFCCSLSREVLSSLLPQDLTGEGLSLGKSGFSRKGGCSEVVGNGSRATWKSWRRERGKWEEICDKTLLCLPVSFHLGQGWDWPPVKTLKYVSRVLLEVVVTLFAERLRNLSNIRSCGPQTSSVRIPSLGNLLEVQVPTPHPRTLDSETLGVGPEIVLSSCPATLILTQV